MSTRPFEEIVTEHGGVVLRVCRAVLGPVDADDAWSETFLAALRAYPELPDGANVEAWLVTIAHRKAIDRTRARARAPVPTAVVPEPATVPPPHEPPDRDLLAALAALPPKQRAAVAYRYLADLAYPDIGELLGSSPTAARRSAADGIAALRAARGPAPVARPTHPERHARPEHPARPETKEPAP